MDCHILFVGGSGAKCAQAFLEAAILRACAPELTQVGKVTLHVIDTDTNTVPQNAIHSLAAKYERCRTLLGEKAYPTQIVRPGQTISPFTQQDETVTLATFLNCARGSLGHGLLQVLIPENQMDMNLKDGLYGRPGLGSAVWRRWASRFGELPASSDIQTALDAQHEVRVIMVGSVFGGTGASGLPTLGRLYREHPGFGGHPNLSVHALVLTPYFMPPTQSPTQRIKGEDNAVRAREVMNSLQAGPVFRSVHFLGLPEPVTLPRYDEVQQDNPTTVVERLAAWLLWTRLANQGAKLEGHQVLSVADDAHVRFDDLHGAGGPEWCRSLYRHAAAMAFLAYEYGHHWQGDPDRLKQLEEVAGAYRAALEAWLKEEPHQAPFGRKEALRALASRWLTPGAEPDPAWNEALAPLADAAGKRLNLFQKAHPKAAFHPELADAHDALVKALN